MKISELLEAINNSQLEYIVDKYDEGKISRDRLLLELDNFMNQYELRLVKLEQDNEKRNNQLDSNTTAVGALTSDNSPLITAIRQLTKALNDWSNNPPTK